MKHSKLDKWISSNCKFATPRGQGRPTAPPHEDIPLPQVQPPQPIPRQQGPATPFPFAPDIPNTTQGDLDTLLADYRSNPTDEKFDRICQYPKGSGTVLSFVTDVLTRKGIPEADAEALKLVFETVKKGRDFMAYLNYLLPFWPSRTREEPKPSNEEYFRRKFDPMLEANPSLPAAIDQYKREHWTDDKGQPIDIPAALEWVNQQILAYKDWFPNWKAIYPVNPSPKMQDAIASLERFLIPVPDEARNNVEVINSIIAANPSLRIRPVTEARGKVKVDTYQFAIKCLKQHGVVIPSEYQLTTEMLKPSRAGIRFPVPPTAQAPTTQTSSWAINNCKFAKLSLKDILDERGQLFLVKRMGTSVLVNGIHADAEIAEMMGVKIGDLLFEVVDGTDGKKFG